MASSQANAVLSQSDLSIIELINTVMKLPIESRTLYVDLEGVSLSRHGSISIITIWIEHQGFAYLVDVHSLGKLAFEIEGPSGITLKTILESPNIPKVFYDVRNDSDALFSHYGIGLQGVDDVQLMENATRPTGQRKFVSGLDRTINNIAPMTLEQKREWTAVKDKGLKMFHPSKGGSYQVFNQRPMSDDILKYCVNDVKYLPGLRDKLWGSLSQQWRVKVTQETENRVRESQAAEYDPQSRDKALGPWEKSTSRFW